MPRIRTIKPEFPQSESMGRISRDARLLFIQLWTLCDDEGRARASSRMLASLLYPYDHDAPRLIEDWMTELEREGCVKRYQSNKNNYLQVLSWSTHQKIDKPSRSKISPFAEDSRTLAEDSPKTREVSSEDQGSRIKEGTKDRRTEELSPSASLQAHSSADAEELTSSPVTNANGSTPDCPYQAIAEAYHQELPELPSIVVMTPARKRSLQARWREVCTAEHLDVAAGITFFRDYFRRIRQSDFLLGKAPPKKPGERTFRADFDWIFNPANFIKIVEGRYHGRRH
jgi:hypothetical protein